MKKWQDLKKKSATWLKTRTKKTRTSIRKSNISKACFWKRWIEKTETLKVKENRMRKKSLSNLRKRNKIRLRKFLRKNKTLPKETKGNRLPCITINVLWRCTQNYTIILILLCSSPIGKRLHLLRLILTTLNITLSINLTWWRHLRSQDTQQTHSRIQFPRFQWRRLRKSFVFLQAISWRHIPFRWRSSAKERSPWRKKEKQNLINEIRLKVNNIMMPEIYR